MDYTEIGYNEFLIRKPEDKIVEWTEDESSLGINQIASTQVSFGTSSSASGEFKIKWDENRLIITDGNRNRVVLGDMDQLGYYGLRIIESDGTVHFERTDEAGGDVG
jgi:hypothetical protein